VNPGTVTPPVRVTPAPTISARYVRNAGSGTYRYDPDNGSAPRATEAGFIEISDPSGLGNYRFEVVQPGDTITAWGDGTWIGSFGRLVTIDQYGRFSQEWNPAITQFPVYVRLFAGAVFVDVQLPTAVNADYVPFDGGGAN
jgi:hypothetical protein